ncbi:bifunctional fucokinase/fucose-1-phosphate guanylyltransferase [Opitutus sp. ER46]|uniref:bifunctional fucokinase/fucose-1-phosphate guanylyltransferase n=1 Tax=Opitutus sp. ER46 TaxID=2161864 RepID=UPI001304FE8F|nr:bifunctional fucokinase/fucose-1-phosphate guanylyltransferase [Opitutus sp. ER46]
MDTWLRSTQRPGFPFHGLADYVGSDPVGARLGSGGGTVALLHAAWLADRKGGRFGEWVRGAQRLVLHAGGESRRLPAYASVGKALLPVPFSLPGHPVRFDQVLADFQLPAYRQVLREAGDHCALMVASGDVWLELDPLLVPKIQSDIAGIGMRVAPEVAQHFGVFFVAKTAGGNNRGGAHEHGIAFFLQKPSPAEIYRHAAKYDFFVDTGLWLFSAPGVEFLFRRCGWDANHSVFAGKHNRPAHLDLYTEIGAALGSETPASQSLRKLGWSQLTTSVIPLEDARFFHFGSSRQLLESCEQLAATTLERPKTFSFATARESVTHRSNLPVWLDAANSTSPSQLEGFNVLTGAAPVGLRLPQEHCVEIAPVGRDAYVVRPYALDDRLRGAPDGGGTICGQDAALWLERRQLGIPHGDVFQLPVYPVLTRERINQALINWFFAAEPDPVISAEVHDATRLSASAIPASVNFDRYFAERDAGHTQVLVSQLSACLETGDGRVFLQDFAAIARHAKRQPSLKSWLLRNGRKLLCRVNRPEHRSRLLMLLADISPSKSAARLSSEAHACLQRGVIASDELGRSQPRLALKEDQIVWGRSPVRLDLAGGWTDTPPYCLEHGGSVLNLAVLLNGQPPIQVFVRPLTEPVISLRSIDLGAAEVIKTYNGLNTFRDPRSGFSLPKAALAMAGFHPDFSAGRPAPTLASRLKRFGGGLEISLLSAVPKGSGLGTSSILAATILGALNRACGLGWDEVSLYNRVLGVEQLLTTGGGWQDQAGALFRGIKLVETSAGSAQTPSVRYLPQHLFGPTHANRTMLLYYTGITRLAKGILKEIVHDMFLARFDTLQTLGLIRANAHALFNAVQQSDPHALHRCIARSWDLNKRLDPGTTTPEINTILDRCGSDLAAAKLLGAGGGGYMLLCASNPDAGARIRTKLEQEPPNRRARFIDFEIAESGLEVTVS